MVVSQSLRANLVLLLTQFCFSGWHIIATISLKQGAEPLLIALYRALFATALMHGLVRWNGLVISIDTVDYKRFFMCGIMSFVNFICGISSLSFISPARFAIFQPSIPCLVAALSIGMGLENVTLNKCIGIILAVSGAVIAELWNTGSNDTKEKSIPLGVLFATCQVSAMAGLYVIVKPLLGKYNPAVVTCVYSTISTAFTVVLILARIDTFPVPSFAFYGYYMPWVAIVYAAIFCTLIAFTAMSWAGKILSPTVTAVYSTFQPVGTIFLSIVILGIEVTIPEILGGLMIVAGLVVTSMSPSSTETTKDGQNQTVEPSTHSPLPLETATVCGDSLVMSLSTHTDEAFNGAVGTTSRSRAGSRVVGGILYNPMRSSSRDLEGGQNYEMVDLSCRLYITHVSEHAIARAWWRAWRRKDVHGALTVCSESIIVLSPLRGREPCIVGKQATRKYFEDLMSLGLYGGDCTLDEVHLGSTGICLRCTYCTGSQGLEWLEIDESNKIVSVRLAVLCE